MKIFISTILISLSLFARLNPFESTDTFEEKKNKLLASQLEEKESDDQQIIKEIIITEPKSVIIKNPLFIEDGCNETYSYNLLPFISIGTSIDSFVIDIKQKYKLINQDVDIKNKKLVFDFKGKTNFYTKREVLCHKYFKSFAIGCHRKENYFRIVIELKDDVLKYHEKIDSKTNSILIKYINN